MLLAANPAEKQGCAHASDKQEHPATVARIVILGCGGSGKTVLARRLGELFAIPVIHLDGLYYNSDWASLDASTFLRTQEAMTAQPEWIIDGNYAGSLHVRLVAATTVVFLDFPTRTCLWRIVRRRRQYRGGQHIAAGVYDRITPQFLRYVIAYRRIMRPRVLQSIATHAPTAQVSVLRSRSEVEFFLRCCEGRDDQRASPRRDVVGRLKRTAGCAL